MRRYCLFLVIIGLSACNPSFKGHDSPASNSKDTPIPKNKIEKPKVDTLDKPGEKKANSRVSDTLRPRMAKL